LGSVANLQSKTQVKINQLYNIIQRHNTNPYEGGLVVEVLH